MLASISIQIDTIFTLQVLLDKLDKNKNMSADDKATVIKVNLDYLSLFGLGTKTCFNKDNYQEENCNPFKTINSRPSRCLLPVLTG